MIFGFKIFRRIFVSFAVLIALFLGASYFIQHLAEQKMGDAIEKSFNLKQRPEVHISGFPILLDILRRHIPSVDIVAHDVERNGVKLRTVELRLDSISAVGSLTGTGSLSIKIGGGVANGVVTETDLDTYLKSRGIAVHFTDGRATVRGTGTYLGAKHTFTATGRLHIQGTTLRFDPDQNSVRVDGRQPDAATRSEAERRTTFSIALPQLPLDVKLDSVVVKAGEVDLGARIGPRSIKLR